jgi:hypothetical protein
MARGSHLLVNVRSAGEEGDDERRLRNRAKSRPLGVTFLTRVRADACFQRHYQEGRRLALEDAAAYGLDSVESDFRST